MNIYIILSAKRNKLLGRFVPATFELFEPFFEDIGSAYFSHAYNVNYKLHIIKRIFVFFRPPLAPLPQGPPRCPANTPAAGPPAICRRRPALPGTTQIWCQSPFFPGTRRRPPLPSLKGRRIALPIPRREDIRPRSALWQPRKMLKRLTRRRHS
jgi:hypothetical protein